MNRQKMILFILLIIFATALIWSYISWPRQKKVDTLKYPPGSHLTAEKKRDPLQKSQARSTDATTLRLDLLEQGQTGFKGYKRNIFKPIFVDELAMRKQMAAMPVLPSVQKPVQPPPPPIPPPPRRELAKFTFLGFLNKDNQKTVFLAKDNNILLVKKGDTLEKRYEAVSVTDQALTLLVTDTGEQIVIPLIENRPLGMGR